jgi:medium-chain acyl-[acyl-carrier-protein] hydrolase
MHKLPNDEFVAEIERRFDGMPRAIRENQELLNLLLPTMRADIKLLETYEYTEEPPLENDVLAIGGTDDRAVSTAQIVDWRHHTSQRFTNRMFPGGHFFLFQSGERESDQPLTAVRTIAQQLVRYADTSGGAQSCS